MLASLPAELLDEIVGLLDRSSLRVIALTCRGLSSRARPHLLHTARVKRPRIYTKAED
jgi:hypothetical protein